MSANGRLSLLIDSYWVTTTTVVRSDILSLEHHVS